MRATCPQAHETDVRHKHTEQECLAKLSIKHAHCVYK